MYPRFFLSIISPSFCSPVNPFFLHVGVRYIVVDCCGGTVDITVHELDKDGCLKELYKASGGPFGSVGKSLIHATTLLQQLYGIFLHTGVDLQFEALLCKIFGEDFMTQYRERRSAGFVDLMIAFEARKRNASPRKDTPHNVPLPFSFIDFFKKLKV